MTMLIASRAVQGVGCGGILSLSEIIIGDLGACALRAGVGPPVLTQRLRTRPPPVPLKERGIFLGYLGATWAIASALGRSCSSLRAPFLAGLLSQDLN